MQKELKNMTEKQLLKLKSDVEKRLAFLETNKLDEARKAAEKIAKSFGVDLADILATPAKKRKTIAKGKKVAPKYQNPADNTQKWTGRGRQPLWVKAALEDGKTLDDLKI